MGSEERAPILLYLPLDGRHHGGSGPLVLLLEVRGCKGVDHREAQQEVFTLSPLIPAEELDVLYGYVHAERVGPALRLDVRPEGRGLLHGDRQVALRTDSATALWSSWLWVGVPHSDFVHESVCSRVVCSQQLVA